MEMEDVDFERFWLEYPRKRSKGDARKAWRVLNPSKEIKEKIFCALPLAKKSMEWTKDGGQYIPYPATWLRAEGWEDEYPRAIVDPNTGIRVLNPVYRR